MPSPLSLTFAAAVSVLAACDAPKLKDVEIRDGLLHGDPLTYRDIGPADLNAGVRAVIAFPVRDRDQLEAAIADIYNPASPNFHHYVTRADWMDRFAPLQTDLDAVIAWVTADGIAVARTSSNRVLIEITGTVEQFNTTFTVELHRFVKESDPTFETYGIQTGDDLHAPTEIANLIESVVTADTPPDPDPLSPETGTVTTDPPPTNRLTLATVSKNYGLDALVARGARGRGVTIGVVVGAAFKFKDLQSFWQSQGIRRNDPTVVQTMEPPSTRFTETTLDIEWSGGLAPDADLIVYAGPDSKDTALVYTFNAAIADGVANVVTDSFAHREDVVPRAIRDQYNTAALIAASLGITVIAASGDSAQPDIPGASPFVTSVGGTVLTLDADGARRSENAWDQSGTGDSLSFDVPTWQVGLSTSAKRAVSDVALAAGSRYNTYLFGEWRAFSGTSFAAPVFAGLVAAIDSARITAGKPMAGWLNSVLYTTPAVQASFHDILDGGTGSHFANPGWDYVTGWGAPDADALERALP
jgi:kumamolisin